MNNQEIPRAFPSTEHNQEDGSIYTEHHGMTLRDWFAGQALAGIMADASLRPASVIEFSNMAVRLYEVADVMLAEREKES